MTGGLVAFEHAWFLNFLDHRGLKQIIFTKNSHLTYYR